MKSAAVALCRVSTPEQRESGSLTRQEASVRQASDKLGVEIIKMWSGDASSKVGKNMRRKDLLEAYEFCKHHKSVRYFVVDEVDRFMRSVKEMFYWIVMFDDIGVRVWFAQNPELNEDGAIATLMTALKGFGGESSNEERQRKSVNGHRHAVKEGRHTYPAPPGYTKGPVAGIKVWHPTEAEPWQRALKLVAHGLNKPAEALRWLNSSEFAKHRGPMKLDKFLHHIQNPFYCGQIRVGKQVDSANEVGLHEPMISLEEHHAIIEAIHGRPKRQYSRKQYNPDFPLRKLVSCGECGGKLTGAWQVGGSGNRYPRYRCLSCGTQSHRDELHDQLNSLLSRIDLSQANRKALLRALVEVWQSQRASALRDIERLERDKAKLVAEKSNLVKSLAKMDEEYAADIKEELDKTKVSINAVEHKISALSTDNNDLVEFVAFALKTIASWHEKFWELDPETQQSAINCIFPQGFSYTPKENSSTPKIATLLALTSDSANKKTEDLTSSALLVELRGIAPRSVESQAQALQT